MRVAAAAPRIAEALPVVRALGLEAVGEGLFEKTVLITNAVSVERQVHRRGGIEEARRKTSQTAVAERCVFDIFECCKIESAVREFLPDLVKDPERKQVVVNHTPHKVLRREVICGPGALMRVTAFVPRVRNCAHDDRSQRRMKLLHRRLLERHLCIALQDKFDLLHDCFCIHNHPIPISEFMSL